MLTMRLPLASLLLALLIQDVEGVLAEPLQTVQCCDNATYAECRPAGIDGYPEDPCRAWQTLRDISRDQCKEQYTPSCYDVAFEVTLQKDERLLVYTMPAHTRNFTFQLNSSDGSLLTRIVEEKTNRCIIGQEDDCACNPCNGYKCELAYHGNWDINLTCNEDKTSETTVIQAQDGTRHKLRIEVMGSEYSKAALHISTCENCHIPETTLQDAFYRADRDESGELNLKEFEAFVQDPVVKEYLQWEGIVIAEESGRRLSAKNGEPLSAKELVSLVDSVGQLMLLLDSNRNHAISFEEFLDGTKDIEKLKQKLEGADDSSGGLSPDEFLKYLHSKQAEDCFKDAGLTGKELFMLVNLNGDGVISPWEFIKFCMPRWSGSKESIPGDMDLTMVAGAMHAAKSVGLFDGTVGTTGFQPPADARWRVAPTVAAAVAVALASLVASFAAAAWYQGWAGGRGTLDGSSVQPMNATLEEQEQGQGRGGGLERENLVAPQPQP